MEMLSLAADFRDGPIIFVFHTQEPFTAADWESYIALTKEHGKRQPAGKPYRGMVLTDGAAPNSKQRAEFAKLMSAYSPRPIGAIVTESTIARGAVTAIGWIIDIPRAFAPHRFEDALTHLEIPKDEWPIVYEVLAEANAKIKCEVARRAAASAP